MSIGLRVLNYFASCTLGLINLFYITGTERCTCSIQVSILFFSFFFLKK